MHIKFWNIALLFLLFSAFSGCGDESGNTATLRFRVEFDDATVIRRAQETTDDSGTALYDLSEQGMIGKITLWCTGREIRYIYFPESQNTLSADIIEVEAEIEACEDTGASGVFFINENRRVLGFRSAENVIFSVKAGEEKEVALTLYEADTGTMTLDLDYPLDVSDYVRAFPLECDTGVIFPPLDLSPQITEYLFENIPLGFHFWFRLEDKNGEFFDFYRTPPYSAVAKSSD